MKLELGTQNGEKMGKKQEDIVAIIGQYIELSPTKNNRLKGCCPFHKEKTPSFMVRPEDQTFHCFGCGLEGDVNDFIKRIEGGKHD